MDLAVGISVVRIKMSFDFFLDGPYVFYRQFFHIF